MWRQPKCPSKEDLMDKDAVHTYYEILLRHPKKLNIALATWMDPENIMLSKISQSRKN